MSLVVSIDGKKPDERTPSGRPLSPGEGPTTFFRASIDAPDAPTAFLVRRRSSKAHYHTVDQFQIIVDGEGKFGRQAVSPYYAHFTRAYTPYGPLHSGKGWAFLTLRTRYDPTAQHDFDKLKQIPGRQPWHATKMISFPPQGSGVSLQDIPEIKDDQGLFANALTMAPDTRTVAPDPSGGDGQYLVITKGSLIYEHKEYKAMTVVFVKPEEDAFRIRAGAQGLEGVILNFPQVRPRIPQPKPFSTVGGFQKWQCSLCSFAYDEALGMPDEGIPAGTRWQDVPDNWSCPDCSANKSDFDLLTGTVSILDR